MNFLRITNFMAFARRYLPHLSKYPGVFLYSFIIYSSFNYVISGCFIHHALVRQMSETGHLKSTKSRVLVCGLLNIWLEGPDI